MIQYISESEERQILITKYVDCKTETIQVTCVRHRQIGERAERSEKRRREISVRGGARERG